GQLQLVHEVLGEELGVDCRPAFDHQPPHAPRRVVGCERPHADGIACVDDLGHGAEAVAGVGDAGSGAVDELAALARGEEVGARVELRPSGDRHLQRRRREAPLDALVATGLRPQDEPRVVGTDRGRPDEDRVARRPHGVDAVEVLVVRQQDAGADGADVAVDRHRAGQERVRPVAHQRLRSSTATRAGRGIHSARSTSAPGTPSATAAAAPRPAPSPAAAKTQAVTPSRGPHPARLGSTIPSIASSVSGRRCTTDASTPAVRAATTNVAAWPSTTTVDVSTITGSARRRRSPSRMSVATTFRRRATSTTPAASATSATHATGMNLCTGDGSTTSTAAVMTACTNWPAARSQATERSARPTSCTSRPWR